MLTSFKPIAMGIVSHLIYCCQIWEVLQCVPDNVEHTTEAFQEGGDTKKVFRENDVFRPFESRMK